MRFAEGGNAKEMSEGVAHSECWRDCKIAIVAENASNHLLKSNYSTMTSSLLVALKQLNHAQQILS
jgi:hypothetical protein